MCLNGNGAWKREGETDEGDEEDEEDTKNANYQLPNAQSPMPHAQHYTSLQNKK
ncbi:MULTISPECIES: hypothetical protein [unclassified Tolypothrix]|uniref:hypothetical protein n=1 Tax=unclassified Tolypothrix TaxID=2649714 RepID=UPI0012D7568A|nr:MULTISPECIES: hypothetical protein [unclassified Tolypothrix]UYD32202.1 hypothetical protein HG267_24435 [Tolypothrix sp. PCC 7601]